MDIGEWLKGIGLGQYEATFRQHAIDAEVLPELTDADLEKFGVPFGHRKRLIKAIAKLAATRPEPSEAAHGPLPSPRQPASRADAERRPITVMFCDLVGSTSLAARLDPEDWRNLVSAYLDAASAAVTELGGHVLKKLGDGLMALFGYPRAQENDAERAVRAALAIQRALAELNARNAGAGHPELVARIGLDSGPVVVDATGEVFGDTPNIAARVQGLAEPGSVLVTANVQRQTAGLFVAEDRGPHELKGVAAPVNLFRIVRASGGRRFGARALTPLAGREEELDLLRRRWERAAAGEGQLALVVGEPGIGKSRLVEEFRMKLGETPHTWAEFPSSQLLQNTPLHPLAEWGRQRFGGPDAPAAQRLADLENTLTLIGLDPVEHAPLIAPLVDVPLPPGRAASLPPEELRRRQLAALIAWFLAGARSQPAVLAFEDLHWADPTSLDLMQALAERGRTAPLFIVATARPEFRPPWSLRSHHSVISLSPLDRADVAEMIGEIAARHALSKEVVEGVSERTGGVPLFVEEVTRLLIERGEDGGAHAIPPTLQQSLAARLDRMGEARGVAQIGAVLGRDFTYVLLAAVCGAGDRALSFPSSAGEGGAERRTGYGPLPRTRVGLHEHEPQTASGQTGSPHPIRPFGPPPGQSPGAGSSPLRVEGGSADPALQSALDRLAGADLLIAEGVGHEATYRFKHALIQDAAYDSLLKSRRQALHRRAAEILRDQPERAAAQPEVIAHHFTEAGVDDLAIEWWGKAGDQALRRSAFQEAISHLGKAIAMADKAPAGKTAAASDQRGRLQAAYGNALFAARGPGAPETAQAFARAHESALGDNAAHERLSADFGLWVGGYVRGELAAMREHSTAFLSDVEAKPDSPEAGVAHRTAGITHWFAGEYVEAREHLERALALFQPGRDDDLAFRFGHDAGVAAMLCLALTLWPLGDIGRAVSLVGDAEARSAGFAHVATRAHAKQHAALFELMRGDLSRVAPHATELARLAREHDLPHWRAYGVFFQGLASAGSGASRGGLDEMRHGAKLLDDRNALSFDGFIKIALSEAESLEGDVDRALAILDETLAGCERTGHRTLEAELHRVRGEMLLRRDPKNPVPAEEAFQTAIAIARQQSTRSFGLRAALSLAKLYQSTGRLAEAHAVLAPALEGFPSLLPDGRRAGDKGLVPSGEGAGLLTPDPSPQGERGDAAYDEMPELREAVALLAALAETNEVKAAEAQRRRRMHLQTAYGQAVMWSKGFAAEETKAAFARATELAANSDDFSERFAAAHGQWTIAILRCELRPARELASAFLREAENAGHVMEAGVARRGLAIMSYFAGDFAQARSHCEQALALCDPQHEEEARKRYGEYTGTLATAFLANANWQLGEVDRGRELMESANRRAAELGHAPSMANPLFTKSFLEIQRGDAAAALTGAEALEALAREHGMTLQRTWARLIASWARGRLGDPADGAARLLQGLASLAEHGQRLDVPIYSALLAELEAETLGTESALVRIDEALALANQIAQRCHLAFIHRVRGEILLKRDPGNPAPAEEAFQTAVAIAHEQGARSFGLQAALALARLYQSTARPLEAHAVLSDALEGFSPTPEMPEIAEAQALLAALADSDEVKADAAQRERRLHLQTAYGQALMYSRGYASDESKTAFARARTLAAGVGDASERFDAYYGLFVASLLGGELSLARDTAESFLRDAETEGRMTEAAVARRCMGLARLWQGDLIGAEADLAEALTTSDAERDREAKFRFTADNGVAAAVYLALASWTRGDVKRARALSDEALARADETPHAPTHASVYHFTSLYHMLRGDPEPVRRTAKIPVDLGREHGMAVWLVFGEVLSNWARAWLGDRESGMKGFREALAAYLGQGNKMNVPLFQGLIAELEAEGDDAHGALQRIDEALALANETGEHWTDSLLHRVRGAILLKRDPANPASAEQAFQTAIATAKEQGARSFELRAALLLAKFYQSTGRPAEAHAVLEPALEGFAPTPEMPEIAEAQALLAALENSDEVKNAAASRQRRLQLQTSYGKALMLSRGYGSEEAKAAFAHAQELATGVDNAAQRFDAYFGQWVGSMLRGELRSARETAEAFLREAEKEERTTEAVAAHYSLGTACFYQGGLAEARAHLELALRIFDSESDREATRFGTDIGVAATGYLGFTIRLLGEVGLARNLIEAANARAVESTHAPTLAMAYVHTAIFDMLRDDAEAGRRSAESSLDVSRAHGLGLFLSLGALYSTWARAWLGDRESGVKGFREALAAYLGQGNKLTVPLFQGLIAELEAEGDDAHGALRRIDEALALANETGEHWTDSLLRRIRGAILLKRDPVNPAPAEEAFKAAIAIAKQQGARSFGLQAALRLARLYQSTGRPAEAHTVLSDALEGFQPTPEMPEIAEAEALMERLA